MNQKEKDFEAKVIHSKFHNWMGYRVCENLDDMRSLRNLVKKIQRDAIRNYKYRVRTSTIIRTKENKK